jgi:hypothetical protein
MIKNNLRLGSIVCGCSCCVYMIYCMLVGEYTLELNLWLFFSYFLVILNQGLVLLFSKLLTPRLPTMLLSFSLLACCTVSCIIGSLYYLYVDPIDFSDLRLFIFIIFLQVSCAHSTISSAEFVIKQKNISEFEDSFTSD